MIWRLIPWPVLAGLALVVILGVQTVRVERLKDDLRQARKTATEARLEAGRHKAAADLCKAALGRQNDALDALKRAGDQKLAQADKAAADARVVAASARRQAAALLNAHLRGATACERAEDVRRRFLEAHP